MDIVAAHRRSHGARACVTPARGGRALSLSPGLHSADVLQLRDAFSWPAGRREGGFE